MVRAILCVYFHSIDLCRRFYKNNRKASQRPYMISLLRYPPPQTYSRNSDSIFGSSYTPCFVFWNVTWNSCNKNRRQYQLFTVCINTRLAIPPSSRRSSDCSAGVKSKMIFYHASLSRSFHRILTLIALTGWEPRLCLSFMHPLNLSSAPLSQSVTPT